MHSIFAAITRSHLDATSVAALDAWIVQLAQDCKLIALDPSWLDDLDAKRGGNTYIRSNPNDPCESLGDTFTIQIVRELIPLGSFALVQTEYFGGTGEQMAAVYDQTITIMEPVCAPIGPINSALRLLGVMPRNHCDEFAAIGLGGHRSLRRPYTPSI